MSIKEKFEDIINSSKFQITDYLVAEVEHELNDFQKKKIEQGTTILKENTVGDVTAFGGNLKIHGEKFKEYVTQLENELEKEEYEEIQKTLKKMMKRYIKKLEELIKKTCYAIIPVKEMPWMEVLFRTVPLIKIEEDDFTLFDEIIAYYGEIKCDLSRPIIYGNIQEEDPLFAPYMGELDIDEKKIIQPEGRPQKVSFNFSYVNEVIQSFNKAKMRNQLARYHEGYQRRGDPASDYLNEREDLMKAMKKIRCGITSGRIESEIAVCGVAIPLKEPKHNFVLLMSEKHNEEVFEECFEAFLRFSAACCEIPAPQSVDVDTIEGEQETPNQQSGVQTPGGQNLNVWSEEELAKIAEQRGGNLPEGMDLWSEEELKKLNQERASGIPEGLEVWDEEELKELAKKRQGGGLDIPEWQSDEEMEECGKCGYSLRPEWKECPICGTPTDKTSKSSEKEESSEELANIPSEDQKSQASEPIEDEKNEKNNQDEDIE
ncbi:MAG: hypothetical protein BAJALOKI2v1_1070007 [Promethearchaeota archaeon]|nr:MAG: hypothetical protein BAJALOKI2v1_1070007 [Candidatus Lokiarchaeota archaeon]